MEYDDRVATCAGYRPNVGIAVFNSAGKVLVAQRLDTPGSWQMPQGGIDAGEDPWPAALRELGEEIGTSEVEYLGEIEALLRYDFPDWLYNMHQTNFKGQEQKWFAVRLTVPDSAIDLAAVQPAEFSAWRWVDLAEVPDLIVPFKRATYEEVSRRFARFAK